jgi:hypothetical protein
MVTSVPQEAVSSSSRITTSSISESSPIEDQNHISPPIIINEGSSFISSSHTNSSSSNESEDISKSQSIVQKTDESSDHNSLSNSLNTAKIHIESNTDISPLNLSAIQDPIEVVKGLNEVDNVVSSTIPHEEISSIGDTTSV